MAQPFPLHRHTTQSPLSEEEWRGYFQNGFCIIKGLLSPSKVTETHDALQRLFNQAKKLALSQYPDFDGELYDNGAKFVIKTDSQCQLEKLYRVCGCGSADPVLLEASRHPVLLTVFQDILMSDTFEQLICQFHAKVPGDDVAFPPHRDVEFRMQCDPGWQDINQWGSYVVAVMAIDKSGPNNGGLFIAPGSHSNVNIQGLTPAKDNFNPQWRTSAICPQLDAGDVLLMHPYVVHWSAPNSGEHPRFSLLSGVCSPGANHKNYPGDCTNTILSAR